VPLVQGDAQLLPFASKQFDLVLCFEAIYYLEDYQRFIAESERVLVTEGNVLICQSNPDWPNFVPGALTTRYPRLPELAASLTQAGFREVKCYGTLPITAISVHQKIVSRVRQWVMQSGLLPWLEPLKSLLQRVSYGQLYPLPPTLDAQWVARWQADLSLTPLPPTLPDFVHRVLYVEGTK
jgi:ubiquinone/menaquinone biosynthesis C-methylase UbiE